MKRASFLLAFMFAIASAFTTKFSNPTGWASVGGTHVSGETNDAGCAVRSMGTNCFIVVEGSNVSPVYDSEAHIGISNSILKKL